MQKHHKKIVFITLAAILGIGAIGAGTIVGCINANLTQNSANITLTETNNSHQDEFEKLTDNKNIKIKKSLFSNVKLSKYENIFNNIGESKKDAVFLATKNNPTPVLTTPEKEKVDSVFDSSLIHIKKYGLSSSYVNKVFEKYHVSYKDYHEISTFVQKTSKTATTISEDKDNNKQSILNSQSTLISIPHNVVMDANNFNSYFNSIFLGKLNSYTSTLYDVACASAVATAVSTAAAFSYWACSWFFGISVPDAIAASANAVVDMVNCALLWHQYEGINTLNDKITRLESKIIDPIVRGYGWKNIRQKITTDINYLLGDYNIDFSNAPAVRTECISEQTAASLAEWAVPALGALDIISTLLNISIFVATSSAESYFSTSLATLCWAIEDF